MTTKGSIAGVILAGGMSRRMGGGDKALRVLAEKPMLAHVIERLAPQVGSLALNANGDVSRFDAFGLPVIGDITDDRAGPLAGVLASLRWAASAVPTARFVATAACDTPFFPVNFVSRCIEALGGDNTSIVLVSSGGRVHPIFGLWPVALADDLDQALGAGVRKVLDWTERHRTVIAAFGPSVINGGSVDPFFNANTPGELAEAEAIFAGPGVVLSRDP